jgi:hypothetical protein
MLDQYSVVDEVRNRRYLLEKTQHLVGGFGKGPGDPPGKVIACIYRDCVADQLYRSSSFILWHGVSGFPG